MRRAWPAAHAGVLAGATLCLVVCMSLCAGALHAQPRGVDATRDPNRDTRVSRQVLEDSSRDNCEGVSVVVQRCVPPVGTAGDSGDASKSRDALTRSRARAKAAFDRRDRRTRQDALENPGDARAGAASGGPAQRLAPVIVTGNAAEPPPSVEEVLQRALSPRAISPSGTEVFYGPDGTRIECVSPCMGIMCCVTIRTRPDPARESNSIGR